MPLPPPRDLARVVFALFFNRLRTFARWHFLCRASQVGNGSRRRTFYPQATHQCETCGVIPCGSIVSLQPRPALPSQASWSARRPRPRSSSTSTRRTSGCWSRLTGSSPTTGRCRPVGLATRRRAGPSGRSAWTSTTAARNTTTRRCPIRSSSPPTASPSAEPMNRAISAGRFRTAASGCRSPMRPCSGIWSSRRTWPTRWSSSAVRRRSVDASRR